jgi:hypothetical protein
MRLNPTAIWGVAEKGRVADLGKPPKENSQEPAAPQKEIPQPQQVDLELGGPLNPPHEETQVKPPDIQPPPPIKRPLRESPQEPPELGPTSPKV